MKKIILLIVLMITLTGCSNSNLGKDNENIYHISLSEIQERMEDGDKFKVLFYSPQCSDCVKYMKILDKYASNNDVTINVYNITENEDEFFKFEGTVLLGTMDKTPSTYYFEDNDFILYEGVPSEDELDIIWKN